MQSNIVFERVWKKFRRGERHDSLRDLIPALAQNVLRRSRREELASDQEFWAVRDVSFEVKSGEALGIIGPNGAGKSTTLKLLTKILKPTRGECFVRGRVGALIEVAAGFHPDLTGRENIYLQGAIMGMRRAEIATKLDEIIDFAGVSDFIDTPVKRYSSGMNARLGFSIAAHLEPDVLIIDEVLSVGDVTFQQRCIERMRSFKQKGVAIVFVSHNLQAVSDLCTSAVYLKSSVQHYGSAQDVIAKYAEAAAGSRIVSDAVTLRDATLLEHGRSAAVGPGRELVLRATFQITQPIGDLTFGFIVHRTTDGLVVYDGNVTDAQLGLHKLNPGDSFSVDFGFKANLLRGQYHVECHVFHNPTQRFLLRASPLALLTILESDAYAGIAYLDLDARLKGDRAHREVPSLVSS